MNTTIGVPKGLADKVSEFVRTEAPDCHVSTEGSGTVQVVEAQDGVQSSSALLQAGGWITCPDAFAMAGRLGIPTQSVGKLLDLLDVRIRSCQLGCF